MLVGCFLFLFACMAYFHNSDDTYVLYLGEPVLASLFIKLNMPVPSSAAVGRLFSIGKDIFQAKRAALSDENFEMLMFLKGSFPDPDQTGCSYFAPSGFNRVCSRSELSLYLWCDMS
jgi:hypothetical protein